MSGKFFPGKRITFYISLHRGSHVSDTDQCSVVHGRCSGTIPHLMAFVAVVLYLFGYFFPP